MELEQLYREHSDRVYSYIWMLVRHKQTAEDLTQETFYKAYKGYDNFNQQSSIPTWLLKIARILRTIIFEGKKLSSSLALKKSMTTIQRKSHQKVMQKKMRSLLECTPL